MHNAQSFVHPIPLSYAVPGIICWKFISVTAGWWKYSGDAQLMEGLGFGLVWGICAGSDPDLFIIKSDERNSFVIPHFSFICVTED